MSSKTLLLKIVKLTEENDELYDKYNHLTDKYNNLKTKCNRLIRDEQEKFEKFLKEYPHLTDTFPRETSHWDV